MPLIICYNSFSRTVGRLHQAFMIDQNRTAIEGIEGTVGSISGVINANETALSTGTIFITAPGYKGIVKGALPCTGGRYNRSAYPALFNAIGNANGVYANMTSNISSVSNAAVYSDAIGNKIHMIYKTSTSGGSIMYRRYSSSGTVEKELTIASVSKQASNLLIYAANQVVFARWNDSAYSHDQFSTSTNMGESFSSGGHWNLTYCDGRTKNGLILSGRTGTTATTTYYKYIAPGVSYSLSSSSASKVYSDSLSKYIYEQVSTQTASYYDLYRIDPENNFAKTTLQSNINGALSKYFFTINGKDCTFDYSGSSVYSMNPNGTSINYEGLAKWANGNSPSSRLPTVAITNFPDGTPLVVYNNTPYTISSNMVFTKCEITVSDSYSNYLTVMSNGDIVTWYSRAPYENVQFKVPDNSNETNVFYIKT